MRSCVGVAGWWGEYSGPLPAALPAGGTVPTAVGTRPEGRGENAIAGGGTMKYGEPLGVVLPLSRARGRGAARSGGEGSVLRGFRQGATLAAGARALRSISTSHFPLQGGAMG